MIKLNTFLYTLVVISLNVKAEINLEALKVSDTDAKVIKKKLFNKYFQNKYKVYTWEHLRNFLYELHLDIKEIPDARKLKSWGRGRRHNLELIDHFMEQH